MNRSLVSAATIILVACPLIALGVIGGAFLASPNDRPQECEPLALAALGPEPTLVALCVARRDAWMRVEPETVGWAHVRRAVGGEIVVLGAAHPRLGCFLTYDRAAGCYESWCHYARYDLDGRWFYEAEHSEHRMTDMCRPAFRIDGNRLAIALPKANGVIAAEP